MVLTNILHKDNSGESVDVFINPALGAVIHDSDDRQDICGVHEARNELYLYSLEPSQATVYSLAFDHNYYPHSSDDYIIKRRSYDDDRKTIGTCIFKLPDEKNKITSITGFPGMRRANDVLAIGLDNGEIIVGEIISDSFHQSMQLQPAAMSMQDARLYSTPVGILVAHLPGSRELRVWNLMNDEKPTVYQCPDLYNLAVSVDGKYLTALESTDGGYSQRVHCFELQAFKHHIINLKNDTVDFVIGKDSMVVAIANKLNYDKTEKTLQWDHLGDVEGLLNPQPVAAEENQMARQPATIGRKLFGLLAKLRKDDQHQSERSDQQRNNTHK
jgi:hypothetical protein